MTAVVNRWSGTGVAPGAAVASSRWADLPIPGKSGPLELDQIERAFRAVATGLNRVASQLWIQGRLTAADIVAAGTHVGGDAGHMDAARRAATTDDP